MQKQEYRVHGIHASWEDDKEDFFIAFELGRGVTFSFMIPRNEVLRLIKKYDMNIIEETLCHPDDPAYQQGKRHEMDIEDYAEYCLYTDDAITMAEDFLNCKIIKLTK